jgi:hypothetical protein
MTGLAGHSAEYTQAVWWVASAFGAGVLIVLIVLYRRARAAAQLDEVERILRDDEGPSNPCTARASGADTA